MWYLRSSLYIVALFQIQAEVPVKKIQKSVSNKPIDEVMTNLAVYVFRSGTHLVLVSVGATLFKNPKASSFQIGSGCYLASKYASIDEVGFSIKGHVFKTTAMTSFQATSAAICDCDCICSVRQAPAG